MTDEISLLLVFAAGLLSFLSPCVLPLIPSYLSILGGVGIDKEQNSRPRLVLTALAFVLGFSAVFIVLSVIISTSFLLIGGVSAYINLAAGIIIFVLGFNIIFDFFSFLNYEKRPWFSERMQKIHAGIFLKCLGAFIAGAAFAAGWTPCIGPILAGILLMAGTTGKAGAAVIYLVVYSIGLGLPFVLAAVFFDSFIKHSAKFRSALPLIRRVSGIILVIIGVMILTGRYSEINIFIQKMIYNYTEWAEDKALPFRAFADWLLWLGKF